MPDAPSILIPPVFGKGLLFGDVEQPKQGIFEVSELQQLAVGTLITFNDGRKYRYCKNGAVIQVKGLMTSQGAQDSKLVAEAQSTSGTAVEIGDIEIVVDVTTATSLAENDLVNGTVIVESGTAIGDGYPIIASKLDVSDDTLLRLRLRYPIRQAWSASTVITIRKSPYFDTVVFPTTAEGKAAGQCQLAVPIDYFYWGQTGGSTAFLIDNSDTLVKGEPAGAPGSAGAAGEIGNVANDGTDQIWGVTEYGIAGDNVGLVYLTID